VSGNQEREADEWLGHLRNTLFDKDSRVSDQLEDKIKHVWPHIEVTVCRTQANRFFCVRCKKCEQFSYGQYGRWATDLDPEKPQDARDVLAKFFTFEVKGGGKRDV